MTTFYDKIRIYESIFAQFDPLSDKYTKQAHLKYYIDNQYLLDRQVKK